MVGLTSLLHGVTVKIDFPGNSSHPQVFQVRKRTGKDAGKIFAMKVLKKVLTLVGFCDFFSEQATLSYSSLFSMHV